jgi:hypothetical protein
MQVMYNRKATPKFLPIHGIIHHKYLAVIHFTYENVTKTITDFAIPTLDPLPIPNYLEDLALENRTYDISFYCLLKGYQRPM